MTEDEDDCDLELVPCADIKTLTDRDLAAEFLAKRDGEIKYVDELEKFAIFNGARWELDERGKVKRLANDFIARYLEDARRHMGDDPRAKLRLPWLGSADRVSAMLRIVKDEVATHVSEWDADPEVVGVPGGVLDLRSGAVRPPKPGELLLKCASFDPDRGASPSNFLRFLELAQPDPVVRDYLQQLAGCFLLGKPMTTTYSLFVGAGGAGMGTWAAAFIGDAAGGCRGILGTYGVSSDSTVFVSGCKHEREEVAKWAGARAIFADEVFSADRAHMNIPLVNKITGGVQLHGRSAYGTKVEYASGANLSILTNYEPVLTAAGGRPLLRRLAYVSWDAVLDGENFKKFFDAEGPQIMAWAAEGARRVLEAGDLQVPPSVRAKAAKFIAEANPLIQFRDDHMKRAADPGARLKRSVVMERFNEWRRLMRMPPVSPKQFKQELDRAGFTQDERNGNIGIVYGWAWQTTQELPPPEKPKTK